MILAGMCSGILMKKRAKCATLNPTVLILKKGLGLSLCRIFSWGFGAKLTKEEIDVFLDKYCMQMAIDEGPQKQAASQLEPYVQAKVKAMELTEQATVELVQGTLNYLSGRFQGDESGSIEIGGKAVTAVIRGTYEGDKETIQGGLEDALSDALMHNWDDLKFNDRIDKVMGTQYAGATAGKLLGNSNGIARMAGKLMEGDHEGAAQELGGVMQNIDSKAEAVTKGASWLASLGNLGMTYWKSNKVDELYQIYKNGAEDLWGNYVIPGDRETFVEYLNTSSGFTESKSIYRFYNMDKVGEVCEKYGWDFKTYSEMPEKYRNIFQQRAKDGLMKYFELRRQQEQRADESGVLSLSELAGSWYPKENNGSIMLRIYKDEPEDVTSGSMYINFVKRCVSAKIK